MPIETHRRWCLFTSAGNKNNIAQWLEQSTSRQWDLVVAFYGDDDGQYSQLSKESFHAFRTKGAKFQNLKRLIIQHPNFFDDYSYVWVCDDDILMTSKQIEEVFSISETFQFWVAQPAFDARGKISHPLTRYAGPQVDYRIVNFVEVTAPIFRQDKLVDFLHVYDGSLVGWGIDYWYTNHFAANVYGAFAIIDKVCVINPTDEQKGEREIDKLQSTELRRITWEEVRAKYRLTEYPPKVFAYCRIAAPDDDRGADIYRPSIWCRGLMLLQKLKVFGPHRGRHRD